MNFIEESQSMSNAERQRRYRQRRAQSEVTATAIEIAARDVAFRLKTFAGESIVLHIPEDTGDVASYLWEVSKAIQERECERRAYEQEKHLQKSGRLRTEHPDNQAKTKSVKSVRRK
jgi:hypothetical protein